MRNLFRRAVFKVETNTIVSLQRLSPLLFITAHGNRSVVIGHQGFLVDVRNAIGVDIPKANHQGVTQHVIGNEMPAGTRYHAPQVSLGEITTQTQPLLGNLSQRQVHSNPAARHQVFCQIAHHTRMRSAQAQAFALGGKATVFGHRRASRCSRMPLSAAVAVRLD